MLGKTIIIVVANLIFAVDVNCVQVLAPSTACGTSAFGGHYAAGEHIDHLNRQSASVIAPLFDEPSGGEYLLQCHLLYSDTNHSRAGYDVDVVITSLNYVDANELLFNSLQEQNLNPRR